jgi:hypothetical protein
VQSLDHAAHSGAERGLARWLQLGVLCAVAALARLEAVCALASLCFLERTALRERPVRGLALCGPAGISLLCYALWSRLQFDTWLPVSGLAKRAWAQTEPTQWAVVTALLAILGIMLRSWQRHGSPGARCPERAAWVRTSQPLSFLGLSCALMLLLDYVALGQVERWYLGSAVLTAAIALALTLRNTRIGTIALLVVCVALALLRIPFTVGSVHRDAYQAKLRGEAADWLREHLPAGTRIGSWSGGLLAYYSGQPIVMLDGLTNDIHFYRRALLAGELAGYLRDAAIDYVITSNCHFDPNPTISPLEPAAFVPYPPLALANEKHCGAATQSWMLWVRTDLASHATQ